MPAHQFCTPHLLASRKVTALTRLDFEEKRFDEAWFQELLFNNPSLLPVDEIERVFAPLIPLARELPTSAGPIDVAYINPQGYLTLVETKLWRNPEARRQAVAQIIDYATAVSKWSYEELCSAVRRTGRDLPDPVAAAVENEEDFDRARFVDTVTDNLARGRFLLLIVGDGIREGAEHLAGVLSRSPNLEFALSLVELAVFRIGSSDDLFIQPRTLARTREVVRAVVKLKAGIAPSDVAIEIPSNMDEETGGTTRRKISEEVLLEEIAKATSASLADQFREFLRKAEKIGIEPEGRDSSISLFWYEPNTGRRFSFGSVYAEDARVETKFVRMSYRKIGLDQNIGLKYIQALAALVPGATIRENLKEGKAWTRVYVGNREVTLRNLLPKSDDWLAAIQRVIVETEAAGAKKIVTDA